MIYKNSWDVVERHVVDFLPLLAEIGQRGLRVDTERRQSFNSECERQMAALQQKFDQSDELRSLRGYHPKQGYKRQPKDLTGLEIGKFLARVNTDPDQQLFGWVDRYVRRKPFLATSSQQVLAYQRQKGHTIKKTKAGDETSGQKQLLLAWRRYKDDNYRDFVEYRKLKKLRGTYGEWPTVVRDGETFATTTFTLRPDNGRLSSVNPNVQNIPRDGELARLFKSCLAARRGHQILRADLSSAEALVTGWLSGDSVAMRLARLGTHRYATAKYVGLPVSLELSDAALRPLLSKAKLENGVLYRKIKTTIFGGNYLAGPRKVFEQNPEEFESQADAAKFQTFCKSLFPKIGEWQRSTIAQARRQHYLQNPWGYRKAFWDIDGGEAASAVAFLPSSIVAAVMKDVMLELWANEAGKYMIWQIHDELVFDVPEDRIDAVKAQVWAVMTQGWLQLDGLRFDVEISVGDSLAS